MRGISDLDSLCLREIFKNLTPLDLCAMRQCSKGLRYFVDDHFYSFYFIREKLLDLTADESNENVSKIVKNVGKFCRRLKVHQETKEPNLMLDVIARSCGKNLKELSLNNLLLCEKYMVKIEGVFDNLEILELIDCRRDDPQCIKYKNIKFMTVVNVISVAHLRNLKQLQLTGLRRLSFDERSIIPLIRELSVNNKLEIFGITRRLSFTVEFWDALSQLTNLKALRFSHIEIDSEEDKEAIEMLCRKLPKLESLMLVKCYVGLYRRYRNLLESLCKSDTLRKLYIGETMMFFIQPLIEDFIGERRFSCIVSGNPFCIYLENETLNAMKTLFTQDNFKSIEKYENIIFRMYKYEKYHLPNGFTNTIITKPRTV